MNLNTRHEVPPANIWVLLTIGYLDLYLVWLLVKDARLRKLNNDLLDQALKINTEAIQEPKAGGKSQNPYNFAKLIILTKGIFKVKNNLFPVKILLAIGTRIYRDATRELLERFEYIRVEYAASDVSDVITHLNQLSIDLLVIDLRVPGAVEFVLLSQKIQPNLKTIVLAGQDNSQVQRVYDIPGLIGSMLDDMPISYLVDRIIEHFLPANAMLQDKTQTIRSATQVGSQTTPQHLAQPQAQLTRRQFKILALIESGHSNKEISRKLHIETCTVKNHVHNILQRLEAHSRCEAASIFRRAMIKSPYSISKVAS
jgi:DNA-binding NarL/FixJ family response regulator